MSYKALYRTYRPMKFDEVIGQDHIVSTLKNVIKNDKIGHAYLFAGPRGTGKTSVAHVFARAVNKNAANEEVFGDMDIIEIDAASNNGVSEVRTIIDNVNYTPTKAKYKVYIVDEVHMLTKGAFNALLKTLEEPPKHVIFILATTEPHKIPITILSRTQRFNFKRIDNKLIAKQLKNILQKENIKYDDNSIKFISKLAQGGMRDALSIADQSSAFGDGIINFESISQVFGIVATEHQINLLNKAYKGQAKELMSITSSFLDNGVDIERISSSLLEITKDFIIFNKTNDINLLSFLSFDEVELIEIDVFFAYKVIDILMSLITELRFTSVPRQSFELSILKMINGDSKNIIVNTKGITEENTPPKLEEKNVGPKKDIKEEVSVNSEIDKIINVDIIQQESQELAEMDDIENDILTTQEIPINKPQNETKTTEIDIMKLFDANDVSIDKKDVDKPQFNVDEIINLLVQANRDILIKTKNKWNNPQEFNIDKSQKHFLKIIEGTKIISSGNKFVLVSSQERGFVDRSKAERLNPDFLVFLRDFLGRKTLLFAISKDEFDLVKKRWTELSSLNSLPSPKDLILPEFKEKEKTEEENYGESLFGELFSS